MEMRILLEKFRLDSQSKISLKYPFYIPCMYTCKHFNMNTKSTHELRVGSKV